MRLASIWFNETKINQPCDFLVLPLPWLHQQTLVIHLMNIAGCLHVAKYVVLQISDGLQRVRHILVLLNVPNDICRFGAFGEVDKVGLLDDRGYAIFNEGQIGQIST